MYILKQENMMKLSLDIIKRLTFVQKKAPRTLQLFIKIEPLHMSNW